MTNVYERLDPFPKETEKRLREKGAHLISIFSPDTVNAEINYRMAPAGMKIVFKLYMHKDCNLAFIDSYNGNNEPCDLTTYYTKEPVVDYGPYKDTQVYNCEFTMPDHDVIIRIITW